MIMFVNGNNYVMTATNQNDPVPPIIEIKHLGLHVNTKIRVLLIISYIMHIIKISLAICHLILPHKDTRRHTEQRNVHN
jgi:hypothetical protein